MDVMVSCRAVLPGCLIKTCFLPQPQQSCESDANNSYAVCSPKIQQNVTNERLKSGAWSKEAMAHRGNLGNMSPCWGMQVLLDYHTNPNH
jgi:hypothetical protein